MLGFGAIGENAIGGLPNRYTVTAAETPEGKERLRAYYEALGRFADMFARVETAVTLTLWHYAKTSPEVAKVILAGAKIDTSSTFIKQLAAETGADQKTRDDLENVLQQVGIINGVRNSVLHYGATSVAEGNAWVSNALKAKGEPNVFPISPTLLSQMTDDLLKAASHLNYRHLGRSPDTDAESKEFERIFYSSWQYKHPAQTKARAKRGKEGRPHPKRPPKPSRQP